MTLMVEMDTTRAPLGKLYPRGGLKAYHQKSAEEVFLRVMEVLSEDAPGLVHALVVRDVEVIGHVPEGQDLAHVVYRSTADLSGAVPELRLMTVKRDGLRWRVLSSQELDILVEAFRGISRKRSPPPGGWPGGVPPDTAGGGFRGAFQEPGRAGPADPPHDPSPPHPQVSATPPVRSTWHWHPFPRRAEIPSQPMMGTMASPATGSAHHQPRAAFKPSPARRMADR
jgi:hypothetical protein